MSYTRPHRAPDSLLRSDLKDWQKMVWLAIRAKQGSNDEAWHPYEAYGDACGKSFEMVRKAVSALKRDGWLVELRREGNTRFLRCLDATVTGNGVPGDRESRSRSGKSDREQGSQVTGNGVPGDREQGSQVTGNGVPAPIEEQSVQESGKESGKESVQGEGEAGAAVPVLSEPDGFDAFWSVWPNRVGRKAAVRAWAKTGAQDPALAARIVADVERRQVEDYAWTKDAGRFIPHASTYLNGERWEDAYRPAPKPSARDAADHGRNNPDEAFRRSANVILAAITA